MEEGFERSHPDMLRILDAVLSLDADAGDRHGDPNLISEAVDEESLVRVAKARTNAAFQQMVTTRPPEQFPEMLASIFIDGFMAGLRFQKIGGHRDDSS